MVIIMSIHKRKWKKRMRRAARQCIIGIGKDYYPRSYHPILLSQCRRDLKFKKIGIRHNSVTPKMYKEAFYYFVNTDDV